MFVSFAYCRNSSYALGRLGRASERAGLVTVDSGVHTFRELAGVSNIEAGAVRKPRALSVDFDAYVESYIKWLLAHSPLFDYFAEVDLHGIPGITKEQIWRWRQAFLDAGLGEKCIAVMHVGDTEEEFRRLVAEWPSRYLAVEGPSNARDSLPYYAYEHGVRTHLFAGMTREILMRCPFYSADSSTATYSYRYGIVPVFSPESGSIDYAVQPTAHEAIGAGISAGFASARRDPATIRARLTFAYEQYTAFEWFLTRYWQEKGVVWDGASSID